MTKILERIVDNSYMDQNKLDKCNFVCHLENGITSQDASCYQSNPIQMPLGKRFHFNIIDCFQKKNVAIPDRFPVGL